MIKKILKFLLRKSPKPKNQSTPPAKLVVSEETTIVIDPDSLPLVHLGRLDEIV